MGMLCRCRDANRFAAIVDMVEGIDQNKLAKIMSAYTDGSVAYDKDGKQMYDENGDELGGLQVAISKLSSDEKEKLKAFVTSIKGGTHPRAKEMAELVLAAEELPGGGWIQPTSAHEILRSLLVDILGDLDAWL